MLSITVCTRASDGNVSLLFNLTLLFASLAHSYKWLMSSSEPQEINVPRFHPHPKFFLPTNVHQLPAPNSYCAKSAPSVPGSFINHLTPAYSPILDAPLFPNFWGNFAWDRLADTEHVTELSSARHVWPQDKHWYNNVCRTRRGKS